MNEQSSRTTRSLTADELSVLCWQLSLLSRAGVPWTECAGLLLEDGQPPRVKAALTQLQGPLSEGVPLSSAMEAAGTFPPYLLRMVEIGQLSGRLDQVLSALSDYYRRESATLDAIRRAVTYPAVMAALIALVFLVLVSRVLPFCWRARWRCSSFSAGSGASASFPGAPRPRPWPADAFPPPWP